MVSATRADMATHPTLSSRNLFQPSSSSSCSAIAATTRSHRHFLVLSFVTVALLSYLLTVPQFVVEVDSDALADGTWLAALYNVTNGPGWASSCRTNWNITNPGSVCNSPTWSKVTCNATNSSGVVTGVSLNACNLRGGPLPPIVGTALAYCRTLYLHTNSVTGTIPTSLGSLSSLQLLYLYSNSLTGTLPSSLGDLSSLQQLYLNSNSLTGALPSSLGNLSSLVQMSMFAIGLTGTVPSSFGNLSSLQEMYLYSNRLNGTIPSSLSSMSSLKTLSLHSNSLTGSVPSSLSSLSSLRYLYLDTNSLTGAIPTSFSNLSSLIYLSLNSNSLTGSLPSSFSNLSSLVELYLNSNSLTGSVPAAYFNMFSLQTLYLHSNGLNSTLPSLFSGRSSLRTLYLYSNSFTGAIPSSFGSLSSLKTLSMYSNNLTGTIPSSFGSLSSLIYLSLNSNSLTGSLPSSFSNMSSLQQLYLNSNSLTGTLPSSWNTLNPLCTACFQVSSNYLMGNIPSSWLWSNATIKGAYLAGNCLNVSNMTAVTATARFDTSGAPRSNASVCAAVAASQAAAQAPVIPRTATKSSSASVSGETETAVVGSRSASVTSRGTGSVLSGTATGTSSLLSSLSLSASVSRSASVVTMTVPSRTALHSLTESLPLSLSPIHSVTNSLSLLDCEEMVMCSVRQATNSTCHGCTLLDPRPGQVLPADGALIFAQVSREALEKTASSGSLQVAVQCTSPRFLRLVNRSTATLNVVAQSVPASEGGRQLLQMSLPTAAAGGWLSWSAQQSPYRSYTMEFPLPAECGDRSVTLTLAVLVTPLALPQLALGGAVQATDRATTWLGAIGGGASSGGSSSRVAAMRSLLLCSQEGASTGGLLGLSLPRTSDGDRDGALLAYARGAVVGNTLVLVVWLVVLLALAVVYHCLVSPSSPGGATSPGLAACVRVALPSSLLPVCSSLLPSLSGGVLILAAVGGTRLDAVDMLALVGGCCVLVGVLVPLLWLCAPSFATGTLHIALVEVDNGGGGAAHHAATATSSSGTSCDAVLVWGRLVKPRWVWRPHPGIKADGSGGRSRIEAPSDIAARGCNVILSDHRCLWYATLDMCLLCTTGFLAAASGVIDTSNADSSSSYVCSGAAIALTALILLQFTVVVAVRPLTSVFANVHTAFVLLLTGLGTVMQAVAITRGGSGSGITGDDWALLGAAACSFLVLGVSLVRVVVIDAPLTFGGVKKFVLELASSGSRYRRLSKSNGTATGEELKQCSPHPLTPPAEEEDVEWNTLLDAEDFDSVNALNRDFWDDVTGEVRPLKEHDDANNDDDDDDVAMDALFGGSIPTSLDDEACEGDGAPLLRFRL